jgi:hypothetical protein
MKLEMMTAEDVELRVRLETDPQMMAELGGPRPREAIERAHAKSLALAAEGKVLAAEGRPGRCSLSRWRGRRF